MHLETLCETLSSFSSRKNLCLEGLQQQWRSLKGPKAFYLALLSLDEQPCFKERPPLFLVGNSRASESQALGLFCFTFMNCSLKNKLLLFSVTFPMLKVSKHYLHFFVFLPNFFPSKKDLLFTALLRNHNLHIRRCSLEFVKTI